MTEVAFPLDFFGRPNIACLLGGALCDAPASPAVQPWVGLPNRPDAIMVCKPPFRAVCLLARSTAQLAVLRSTCTTTVAHSGTCRHSATTRRHASHRHIHNEISPECQKNVDKFAEVVNAAKAQLKPYYRIPAARSRLGTSILVMLTDVVVRARRRFAVRFICVLLRRSARTSSARSSSGCSALSTRTLLLARARCTPSSPRMTSTGSYAFL